MFLSLYLRLGILLLLGVSGCRAHTQKTPPKNFANDNKAFFGPRGAPEIKVIVEEHLLEINECFELNGAKNGTRIVVQFIVNQLGNVRQAKVVGQTSKNQELALCVCDVVYSWQFDPSPDFSKTEVTYPFLYSKREGHPGVTTVVR